MVTALRRLTPDRLIIAVTMGDAAGVGPELCLRLLARPTLPGHAVPLIIGNAAVLARVARRIRVPFRAPRLRAPPDTLAQPAVFDPPGALIGSAVVPGKNQRPCGRAAARYIREAVRGCMDGRFAAMVTAPISKKALHMAGVHYPGHTEMLAALTRAPSYAMLFYSPRLACAFVTCHQSLRSVPRALTAGRIVEVAELAWRSIMALRRKPLPLCLLGLNPHAGEEGLFGAEEQRILLPAKRILEARGIPVEGPLPPDTAFLPHVRRRFACHIALYHDQGCIPFKMLAFDSGVNVTMGLPIIRTSPDHGTAFDIAWQGKARPDSFFAACELATRLAAAARHSPREEKRR
ncbi:MAG: 4-hydroxythreonine-4-phosphate dehydrogenase PdxA [Planctomycetota bacterium]|nr:4-hydroxythreonine-4-phosphate dehydrogenase PdxA [Planctomycetota bacterium]